jgi:hypothetical protein
LKFDGSWQQKVEPEFFIEQISLHVHAFTVACWIATHESPRHRVGNTGRNFVSFTGKNSAVVAKGGFTSYRTMGGRIDLHTLAFSTILVLKTRRLSPNSGSCCIGFPRGYYVDVHHVRDEIKTSSPFLGKAITALTVSLAVQGVPQRRADVVT